MSATLLRPVMTPHTETLAVWCAQPGAFLIVGQTSAPIPKAGSARLAASAGGVGVFRAEFWPSASAGYAFLAVVRLPSSVGMATNAELAMRGARNGDRDFRIHLVPSCAEEDFGAQLARCSSGNHVKLLHFLIDLMQSDERGNRPRPHGLLESFLASAARADGCVELILNVPGKCVLLQGWGSKQAESVSVFLPGQGSVKLQADTFEFSRDDVQTPYTGIALALPADAVEGLSSAKLLYLLTDDAILSRHVVNPRILGHDDSVGQIRHLLPRLVGPPALKERLRELSQPRYTGQDTLGSSARPVRAAVDVAVRSVAGGAYLSGWFFDPGNQVVKVEVCWDDHAVRVDRLMTRIPREDVTAAFRPDPNFPHAITNDWGFAVSFSDIVPQEAATYVRLTFSDGDVAFIPVRTACAGATEVLQALPATVDLHKSSGLTVIERHLAPFLARSSSETEIGAQLILAGPVDRPRAIVVPLRGPVLPRPLIANFLESGPRTDEQLVFVCGRDWGRHETNYLIQLLRFYDLPASVVSIPGIARGLSACRATADLTNAELFLLVRPDIAGLTQVARRTMYAATADYDVLCPTILYEDRSIRFAGRASIEAVERAPFVRANVAFAGYPSAVTRDEVLQTMVGGTLACCLMQRSALAHLCGQHTFYSEGFEEIAAFQVAKRSAVRCGWAPSVQIAIPEDDSVGLSEVQHLIDGWMVKHLVSGASECAS